MEKKDDRVRFRTLPGIGFSQVILASSFILVACLADPQYSTTATSLPRYLRLDSENRIPFQAQEGKDDPVYVLSRSERAVSKEIGKGRKHNYQINVAAGSFLKVVVEQRGVDVALRLFGPDGKQIEEVDSPNGTEGPESFAVVTDRAGVYRIEVQSLDEQAPAGKYEIKVAELKPAGQMEREIARADSLHRKAVGLEVSGNYGEASKLAEEALAVMEKLYQRDAPELSDYLLHLGQLCKTRADLKKAEGLFRQALAAREKQFGKDHPLVANVLDELGNIDRAKGDLVSADQLYRRALGIREKTFEAENPETALSLNYVAEISRERGDYTAAEPLYKRSLKIFETTLGRDNPDITLVLNNYAELCRARADYARAESFFKRSLDIYEKAFGKEHPNVALALKNLGTLYVQKADFNTAEPLLQRALKLYEKTLGPEHPDAITTSNNLAKLYHDKGNYREAETIYRRNLKIREGRLGKEHTLVAGALNNLAALYGELGDYTQAEAMYQRALSIRRKLLGNEHPDVAVVQSNLATLYSKKGNYQKAEEFYLAALATREKTPGPQHPDFAASLNGLAMLRAGMGDAGVAERMIRRALSIQEVAFGPEHPDVALTLGKLANLYYSANRFSRSEPLYQRALNINKKYFGSEHPSIGRLLNNMGNLYRDLGRFDASAETYRQALQIQEKSLGPDHPSVALVLSDFASLYQVQGRPAKAAELLRRSLEINEISLRRNLSAGSDRQKLAYLSTFRTNLNRILALDAQMKSPDPQIRDLAFSALLKFKGRGLDEIVDTLSLLRRNLGGDEQRLLDQLLSVRAQLSALTLRELDQINPLIYRQQLKELSEQMEKVESEISARSAAYRTTAAAITPERILEALPSGAALVEFAQYQPQGESPRKRPAPRYAAYILTSSDGPHRVDLGEATVIDLMVGLTRKAWRDKRRKDVSTLARSLDERVMRPIRRVIGTNRAMLISPDGSLNLVPFAALVNERGQYLVSRYSFTYLTSGRDLLRLRTKHTGSGEAVIFADPDFGDESGATAAPGGRDLKPVYGAKPAASPAGDKYKIYFGKLPGTAAEAKALGDLIPDAKLFTGKDATEAELKKVFEPRILHIATHGFFLGTPDALTRTKSAVYEPLLSRVLNLRGGRLRDLKPAISGASAERERVDNPLLRSGLALAGANTRKGGDDDGILTALEAAGLNLQGTRLVALSACDTGVGRVESWEGVYGLRRALILAGSESQVISLWSVSDAATKDLMVDYYKRLMRGEGRGDALRGVQLQMLRGRRQKHPYYWAGFIQSGEWGTLDAGR